MTENEVNQRVKKWLLTQDYHYKGILNTKPKTKAERNGYGQVLVPSDGDSQVLIDHQGINDKTKDLIWIEAKGSDVGLSQLLEGFIRVCYACYYGGGRGLLAVPDKEYQELLSHRDFLTKVSTSSERRLGLLNATTNTVRWLI